MAKIGGNIEAILQSKGTERNEIGEMVADWGDVITLKGWLDLSGGDSKYNVYNAKIEESSHTFFCDYVDIEPYGCGSENTRLLIDRKAYDIMLIDDPMNRHEHLEIYLKFLGGQNEQY